MLTRSPQIQRTQAKSKCTVAPLLIRSKGEKSHKNLERRSIDKHTANIHIAASYALCMYYQ
jgi:hypothetical protein